MLAGALCVGCPCLTRKLLVTIITKLHNEKFLIPFAQVEEDRGSRENFRTNMLISLYTFSTPPSTAEEVEFNQSEEGIAVLNLI